MPQGLLSFLRRLADRLALARDWYLILLAAGIGVIMAGVAMAFILPLRELEHLADAIATNRPRMLFWLVPIVPVVGALLAGWIIHIVGGRAYGPGVSSVMYAVQRRRSKLQARIGLRKWLASTATIGSGGSAGAEGPIVTIGSVLGSNVAQLLKLSPQNTATLLGCGAAAGIASVFNAPFAGIFFVMEILLRDFSLRTFTPIVIASVIAAACTQAVLGLGNAEPLFALGEAFGEDAFGLVEIPNYFLLGILCGIAALLFIRGMSFSEDAFERLRVPTMFRPAVGGALLGLIGLASMLYMYSQGVIGVPRFYGNGYPVIEQLTGIEHYFIDGTGQLRAASVVLIPLIVLGVLKAIATCLTIGSGGAGGMFAPSLLMGASVGGAFGYLVNFLGWFPAATPAHYAVVGMAAMVAATTHAPLTAILIVYEITQSYEIILPLMFTAVIATIVGRIVDRDSIYTIKLTRLGLRLGTMSDLTLLRRMVVHDIPLLEAVIVHPNDSAQKLLDLSEQYAVTDFVVVDQDNRYVGMVTGEDLKSALVYREAIPLLQVNELQQTNLPTVTRDEPLDIVLDKFAQHDVSSLAVLSDDEHRVVGRITRARLMHAYQAALDRD